VQPERAVLAPEDVPDLLQPPDRQLLTARQQLGRRGDVVGHLAKPLPGQRIRRIQVIDPAPDRAVRRPVDVVDVGRQGWDATGQEALAQAVRRERQVGEGAETAERLAEHRPGLVAHQLAPDRLGVLHDRVRAEQRQLVGLLPC
jgi:hypothetical protein